MVIQGTSQTAFDSLKENLCHRELQVFSTLRVCGGMTNEELSNLLRLPINQITGRTRGLVLHKDSLGRPLPLVKDSGLRKSGKSGRNAIVWVAI